MSKAILVVDMPECCNDCLAVHMSLSGMFCRKAQKKLKPKQAIPDWCPLVPMPEEKKTSKYMNEKERGYCEGWNVCIDAIERE